MPDSFLFTKNGFYLLENYDDLLDTVAVLGILGTVELLTLFFGNGSKVYNFAILLVNKIYLVTGC